MKHPTTNRRNFWQPMIFLMLVLVYSSCKKTDVKTSGSKQLYAENFFKPPSTSSPELQAIIDLLKTENERSGFVNTLPDGAGLPVWDRLIVEKPKPKPGYSERGIIADKDGNMLIPLSNNNKSLNALLFAMKKDGKYQFYYYDNNYAYGIAFSDKYTIKEREKVMGLFMSMSNYTFGIQNFKSIPKDLFTDIKEGRLPEGDGLTNKMFLVPVKETPPVIFTQGSLGVIGTNSMCFYMFSGTCSCPDNNTGVMSKCEDWWKPCPYDVCTTEQCLTMIVEETPGTDSPDGNPNGGEGPGSGLPGWSNGTGDGGMLPTTSTGGLPNAPCNNCAWYTEMPDYEFEPVPPVIPTLCNMTKEEALEVLNAVTVTETESGSFVTSAQETVGTDGKIRKPVAPVVALASLNFHWGPTPPHYSAFFGGVLYKNSNSDNTWKWESCQYNHTLQDAGDPPPCMEITSTVNVSPIVISNDKLEATTYMSFQFYANITCAGGLIPQYLLYSGGNRTYRIPKGD